ncbi:aminotransferase class I/II-fold pyridoxal phosphate-dependent enzyme [Sphingobacterium sp. lm-10]|uniref:threonine aldolase family protein n=1 Tax=Sphingobacterium sp. lm-10 TaxID=2944904 RepID=UPI00201FDFAE|nr:aminotransferase class I/II-fold pyridoxal phosphate-dependent enzyme [Sphingobacterium sp. lm-10]MCL7986891.1 aminotransferase class I/II-fold pyridoxal phosphate-dependent enzyme [Sphingobacterium sp. lm-10]
MYNFKNDYAEGAHPSILNRLIETNLVQQSGYGEDEYGLRAKELLKEKLGNKWATIHFVSGGTQANLLVISSLLRPHEAVISATSGHIYTNEAGAIEAVGHKVIGIATTDGKLKAADIEKVLESYNLKPHVVKPRLVYISNTTEMGTVYSKTELQDLYAQCKANSLLLFLDGARLGHALMAPGSDLLLEDVSRFTDVFYMGATKNGGLLGEAIIFNHSGVGAEFDYIMKQKGALLAKGRLLGVQFLCLFEGELYLKLAQHANLMAAKIAQAIKKEGYHFLSLPQSNQLFPILPMALIQKLTEKYQFYIWQKVDEKEAAVRLITSWATPEDVVDELIQDIRLFAPEGVPVNLS